MKQGLVLVDIQNDYFSGGAMELACMNQTASNCSKLLAFFRARKAPVFHVQHISTRQGATFFIQNTPGCDIHESVTPLGDESIVIKHAPNSFYNTTLHELLKANNIKEIVVCGAMTHMCIDTTVRAAFDLGYSCQVVSDACATRDLAFNDHIVRAADVQAAFMAALSIPFAKITSTDQYAI